jgi:gas vesicle protein
MSNGGESFVAGFFVGAAFGAVAALLLTPKTGKEMRETLAEEGKRLRERTEGTISELREKGQEVSEKAREAVTETGEGVKKAERTITETPGAAES